jgi:cell division protein FtsB
MNEEIVSKGITEDYVWHEAKSMLAKMKSLQNQLEEFVFIMSKRDKDNKQVIAKLYAENFQMNQEIKDLEEKAKNGPTT